ncbi:MAG: TetR/AcrR family transcriptional regulator [Syntrophobacterales bacterium]|nr:TetR/AcrR family transcriptional regulator [Syntrophobacterales bacterium]
MGHAFLELREEERERRKRLILDAAERIFGSKPFHSVGMRDIAEELGVSVGALYRYFPDKQSLFVEAFMRGAEELIRIIEGAVEEKADPKKVARLYMGFLLEKDHYFKMMSHFMLEGNLEGEALERLNAMEKRLLDTLQRLFESLTFEKKRLITHAFFAALNGVLITFRNYPGRTQKEVHNHVYRLTDLIVDMFLGRMDEIKKTP